MKNPARKKQSVGSRIVQRLEAFQGALKSGQKVTKRFTCRQIVLDLEPVPYGAEQVRATRKLLNVSQALFARFLGVSVSTVRAWEHGTNVPSSMACRFLEEIRRAPEHWIKRLQSALI